MPCHERSLDTDIVIVKTTEWLVCKEALTALESADGVSTAKMYCEVLGGDTVIGLVEPMAFPILVKVEPKP